MPKANVQVSTYEYYHWTSRSSGKTNLILRGGGGEFCVVWFVEDPNAALPPATQSGKNFSLYYHHSQLPHIIDMLRNEKPISVFFDNDAGANSRISTGPEPIGEGEQV